jgi:DnaJ-class molecular chaperone
MKTTTTKQYPDMCRTCNGTGKLADCSDTTNPYRTCPVCMGTGTITITETIICYDDWFKQLKEIVQKTRL